jgi:arsenate reductase
MALTVYEKPTCMTCRKLAALLTERGIDFDRVNYYVDPLSESQLRELLLQAGLSARELLRSRDPIYKELGLADGERSNDELIALMVEHPDLVQRPIVQRGGRAVLARPPEKVLELLD